MITVRRFVGFSVMILAAVMLIACFVGIFQVWAYRQKAINLIQEVSQKLEGGIQRATAAGKNVQSALDLARANVAAVNQQSSKRNDNGEMNRFEADILRGMIQRQVGPSINDLGGRLAVMSDAAIAVSSLLRNLHFAPTSDFGRIDDSRQTQWANQASLLAVKLQQLQGVVGNGDRQATDKDITDATREVELVLQLCQSTLADWLSELAEASARLPIAKSETMYWLHAGAIIITIVCVWVAISQVSLFVHGWGWLRRH